MSRQLHPGDSGRILQDRPKSIAWMRNSSSARIICSLIKIWRRSFSVIWHRPCLAGAVLRACMVQTHLLGGRVSDANPAELAQSTGRNAP